jgi:hypothetical protein
MVNCFCSKVLHLPKRFKNRKNSSLGKLTRVMKGIVVNSLMNVMIHTSHFLIPVVVQTKIKTLISAVYQRILNRLKIIRITFVISLLIRISTCITSLTTNFSSINMRLKIESFQRNSRPLENISQLVHPQCKAVILTSKRTIIRSKTSIISPIHFNSRVIVVCFQIMSRLSFLQNDLVSSEVMLQIPTKVFIEPIMKIEYRLF